MCPRTCVQGVASYILRDVKWWRGIQRKMSKTKENRGNGASIEGFFVTKRGRPTKTIIKSEAQRSKEYRLRQKIGVHHRCKAVIGEPWFELRYPRPQQDVKIIWTGTYDQYVALPGEFCWLPAPGYERPRYCGGDLYILARRDGPYCWRRGYKHITGPSDTPLGSLLGRRCWERKCDDLDKEFEFSRRKSVSKVMNAKFDTSLRGVPVEAGHIADEFEFNEGPRCLVDPPITKPWRYPVGAILPVKPAIVSEMPFAPNWREAMADMMRLVPSREKATPFSGEWSAQASQGGDVSYSDERRSRMRLEPEGPIKGTWRRIARTEWEAKMDRARKQAREREAAGIPLRGKSAAAGGKSTRHLSRDWLAGEAPAALAA
jgi:hypothetical protein